MTAATAEDRRRPIVVGLGTGERGRHDERHRARDRFSAPLYVGTDETDEADEPIAGIGVMERLFAPQEAVRPDRVCAAACGRRREAHESAPFRRQRSSGPPCASAARETFCRRVDHCGRVTPLDDDRVILRDVNDPSLITCKQVRQSDLRNPTADDW